MNVCLPPPQGTDPHSLPPFASSTTISAVRATEKADDITMVDQVMELFDSSVGIGHLEMDYELVSISITRKLQGGTFGPPFPLLILTSVYH